MRRIVCLVALAFAAGCSSKPADSPRTGVPAAAAIDPNQPHVLNADYANWKQFPVGTTVARKAVTARDGNSTTSVETFRLAEVGEAEIVVDRQNTTSRSDSSLTQTNPADTRKFPKSFALPTGMTADDFQKPSMKAKLTGQEVVEIAGKKYATTVYEWTDPTEAGEMKVTVWVSPEVPGRIAKQTMVVEKTATTTLETVESITTPAAKP